MDDYPDVRTDLVSALLTILSLGIRDNQFDDSENLLTAVAILRPELGCIDEFRSFIAIKRGNVREALQMNLAAPLDNSKWYVITALCLKLSNDPTWHSHACHALEMHDQFAPGSHDLARLLLGDVVAKTGEDGSVPQTDAVEGINTDFSNSYGNYFPV